MKWPAFFSCFGAAILCFSLATNLRAAAVDALAYSVSGTAEYAPPQTVDFRPLKTGQVLAIGCTVRTGDDGTVVLRLTPGSSLEMANDSVLKINDLAFAKADGTVTQRKARLELTSGVVSAMVDPSTPSATDFKIQTPAGALVARGTLYTVIVKKGKTYTQVDEGKVSAIATPAGGSI
jgi:hypothetical protein